MDAAGVKTLKQLVVDFDKCDVQVLFAAMTGKTSLAPVINLYNRFSRFPLQTKTGICWTGQSSMTYVAKSGCFLQYKMHFIMLSTAVHWWVSYTITLHFQFQYYTIAVIPENFFEFRRLGKKFLGCKNGGDSYCRLGLCLCSF